MRKLAPFLLVAAIISVWSVIPAPVGPGEAFALDDPALPDAGSLIIVTDGGTLITADTGRTGSWNMALRSDPASYYRMCEANNATGPALSPDGGYLGDDGGWLYDGGQNSGQGSCSATTSNQILDVQRTFDIPVPSNRRFISFFFTGATSSDGGSPSASVQIVTP